MKRNWKKKEEVNEQESCWEEVRKREESFDYINLD